MKLRFFLAALSIAFLQSGCSGGAAYGGGCNDPDYPAAGIRTFIVDPVSGRDEIPAPGSCGRARTVSYLLDQLVQKNARDVDVILEGGTYTEETERFPIVVPDGIRISGSELPGAQRVIFRGIGSYSRSASGDYTATVVLKGAAQLRNVEIRSSATALLLDDTRSGARVQSVDITECVRGLLALSGSLAAVSALRVANCSGVGIETHDASAPEFSRSTVTDNAIGVLALDDSRPVFGGDEAGSNSFVSNSLCDFKSSSTAIVDAVDNIWDDDVFSFLPATLCLGGENLVVETPGRVIYQYLPRQGAPLFPATKLLALLQPVHNSFISGTQPIFAWSAGSRSNKVALGVWDARPDVGPLGIRNPGHMVLFWHSGLETGSIGYVRFEDMKTPIDGSVRELGQPVPIAAGRPYYWAVWEWDEEGLRVEYSSEVRAFTLR